MKKPGMIFAAAAAIFAMSTAVFAQDTPGSNLKDVHDYMGKTWVTVADELEIKDQNHVNGIVELCLDSEAVVLYCEEDPALNGKQYPVIAIDLNQAAAGLYRMGDLWIGQNISDAGYALYAAQYSEVETHTLNDDYYYCVYLNVSTGFAYEVTYDRFSYVTRVQYRHMTEYERVKYAL